jgi:hypothetical protein
MCLYFDGSPIKNLASNRMAGSTLAAYKYKTGCGRLRLLPSKKAQGVCICILLYFIDQTFSFNAGIEAAFSKRF